MDWFSWKPNISLSLNYIIKKSTKATLTEELKMWKQWKLKHMCMITFTNQVELSLQRERTRLSGNVNSSQKHTRVTSTWQRKVSPCFTRNRFRRRWIGNFLTTWNFTSLDFLQICKFPLNQSEIPGLSQILKKFHFPNLFFDLWQPWNTHS